MRYAVLVSACVFSNVALAQSSALPASQAADDLTPVAAAEKAVNECIRGSDFNACVVATTRYIYADRRNKGYHTEGVFTKNLNYGSQIEAIRASQTRPATMCVAATSEIAIEALNFYHKATGDDRPFRIIRAESWNNKRRTDIRSYMWENEGPDDKRGAGYAFATFGAGEILDFRNAKPGDFVSLDRSKFRPRVTWRPDEIEKFSKKEMRTFEGQTGVWQSSGHSTVFLGYLDKSLKWTLTYREGTIVGFLYFSSQGNAAPDGGFNYRWAIFKNSRDSQGADICAASPKLSARLDCALGGIDRKSLRVGRLWQPSRWDETKASGLSERLASEIRRSFTTLLTNDLNALRIQPLSPNSKLNLPGIKDQLGLTPNTAKIQEFIAASVKAELEKQNPNVDTERFDGITD